MSVAGILVDAFAALPASIPSPPKGVWYLGPVPIRAYALCILTGIIITIYFGNKRYIARGGHRDVMFDIALIAVPLGIVGARLYHVVITAGPHYFGKDANYFDIFKIWEGGIGIWGGITFGIAGIWIGAKIARIRVAPFLDSLAPMVLYAQAIGRLGNWFNQELYGRPTDLPWGLEIDAAHLRPGYEVGTLFHPTFLYELLWTGTMATIIVIIDRKVHLYAGQVSALYLIAYSTGRLITEQFRIDPSQIILGLRIHIWVSLVGLAVGIILFFVLRAKAWDRNLSEEELAQTRVSGQTEAPKKTVSKEKQDINKTEVSATGECVNSSDEDK